MLISTTFILKNSFHLYEIRTEKYNFLDMNKFKLTNKMSWYCSRSFLLFMEKTNEIMKSIE